MSTCSRAPVSVVVAAEPARVSAQPSPERKVVRIAGLVQALESQSIRVPQVSGTGGRMTLTRLAPNGSKASKGDIVAEFDRVAKSNNGYLPAERQLWMMKLASVASLQ